MLPDAVRRLKDLESTVVFLSGFNNLYTKNEAEVLYARMSRSRFLHCLVAPHDVCHRVLPSH